MGVNMMLLVLTTLAIAALPSSSLPQLSPTDNQPLPDKETDVAETSVDAVDGDDVEKNFADYIRLCNTLGIRPVGPSYTSSPYYTNNSGNLGYSGYTGTRYPSYYPANYGGSVYYRGNNAAGRSGETESTKESSDEDVEEKYKEYLKLCNTLGVPSSSLGSGAYTTYGGYGGSSNYGYTSYGYPSYGNTGYGGNTGYVVNPGYGGGYGSYSYPANYNVNPVYYRGRGNAAGRSDEVEATEENNDDEEDVEKTVEKYLKACNNLGITPYQGFNTGAYNSYNSGYSGYTVPSYTTYTVNPTYTVYPSNNG